MTDLNDTKPKRKILGLKKAKPEPGEKDMPRYVNNDDTVYMVWNPLGEMPKRAYRHDERALALSHAKKLTLDNGTRFYVMRAWRAFEVEA